MKAKIQKTLGRMMNYKKWMMSLDRRHMHKRSLILINRTKII